MASRGPVYFRAPQWFAFLTHDGTDAGLDDLYVTIDLGSIKSFEQVKAGVLAQAGPCNTQSLPYEGRILFG